MPSESNQGFEHVELFNEFCRTHGVVKAAYLYFTCLMRIARELNQRLGPENLRSELDVQTFCARLSALGTNKRVKSNFKSVLRKYVEMVRSNYKGQFHAITVPAIDVDANEMPSRIQTEISRVVRDTKTARELKRLYAGQCQLCGNRLEIAPGEFYLEAHHLKPLGHPHDGPDRRQNLICVCPNCHVLLDFNVRPLSSRSLKLALHEIGEEFVSYHNEHCR